MQLTSRKVQASRGSTISGAQYAHILGMAITRSWTSIVGGRIPHPSTDVQKYSAVDKTQAQVFTARRSTMVSPTGGILDAVLDLCSRSGPLCQVS